MSRFLYIAFGWLRFAMPNKKQLQPWWLPLPKRLQFLRIPMWIILIASSFHRLTKCQTETRLSPIVSALRGSYGTTGDLEVPLLFPQSKCSSAGVIFNLPVEDELLRAWNDSRAYTQQAKSHGIRLALGHVCATSIVGLKSFDQHWSAQSRERFKTPSTDWRRQAWPTQPHFLGFASLTSTSLATI
jgi:hypothetical protein